MHTGMGGRRGRNTSLEALRRETNTSVEMDGPTEERCEQESAEAWDDIYDQELDLEVARRACALEMDRYRKMNVC